MTWYNQIPNLHKLDKWHNQMLKTHLISELDVNTYKVSND